LWSNNLVCVKQLKMCFIVAPIAMIGFIVTYKIVGLL